MAKNSVNQVKNVQAVSPVQTITETKGAGNKTTAKKNAAPKKTKKTSSKKGSSSSSSNSSTLKSKTALNTQSKVSSNSGVDESKTWAFIAVLLNLLGFLIVYFTRKNDAYAMYYAKQSLILFITLLIGSVIATALGITFILAPLAILFTILLNLAAVIWWIIGMVYSLSGEMKPLPVIGKYAEQLKF